MGKKLLERKSVTPQQAATIYGLSVGHMANLRSKGRGCRFFRCGRRIYYRVDELENWLLGNPVLTTDSIQLNK